MQIGIIKNREIISKTRDSINKAGLDRFLIPDILLKMPLNLPVKKYLRVIQYAYQIGSVEVF